MICLLISLWYVPALLLLIGLGKEDLRLDDLMLYVLVSALGPILYLPYYWDQYKGMIVQRLR